MCIEKVEISGLCQRYDIEWNNLHPDVNVLAGINGSGKSTILDCIFTHLTNKKESLGNEKTDKVNIILKNSREMPNNNNYAININIISTFDMPLIPLEAAQQLSDERVKTYLDWKIHKLGQICWNYLRNISREKDRIIETSDSPKEELLKLKQPLDKFIRIVNKFFSETGKKINRDENEISFLSGSTKINAYQLSSGEKQLLIILLTVLVQDNKPFILLIDEPEISLHIEWQRKLIKYIRELNLNVQIILATHSPAIIMEGWLDKVFEVRDLIVKDCTTC